MGLLDHMVVLFLAVLSVCQTCAGVHAMSLQSCPINCDPCKNTGMGLPCPPPGDLPHQGPNPTLLHLGRQILYHQCHLATPHQTYACLQTIASTVPSTWISLPSILPRAHSNSSFLPQKHIQDKFHPPVGLSLSTLISFFRGL